MYYIIETNHHRHNQENKSIPFANRKEIQKFIQNNLFLYIPECTMNPLPRSNASLKNLLSFISEHNHSGLSYKIKYVKE